MARPKEDIMISMEEAFYGVVDPRRRQERKDSRMIQEDRTKVANLSDQALHHEFNQNKYVEHFRQNKYEISGD